MSDFRNILKSTIISKNMTLFQSHRRYNPLKDEWVLVSPQRTSRPWKGKQEKIIKDKKSAYDNQCYLCPGNKRASGQINPQYENTFVFDNDFPAISKSNQPKIQQESGIFFSENVNGACRVVCFSPKHDLTLAEMPEKKIENVINTWIKETKTLSKIYKWVQIFENKGEMMGCSNLHPHGQIWAGNFIPTEISKEDTQQKNYFQKKQSPLLVDYLQVEQLKQERIVIENNNWIVLVPFWATWPYEIMIIPQNHHPNLIQLSSSETTDLAKIMKKILVAYDKLFDTSMPYSMGWHFAPSYGKNNNHWQLHAHYYPPLLRSAVVKKFMVGYEMLSEAQRDITPEEATKKLKKLVNRRLH